MLTWIEYNIKAFFLIVYILVGSQSVQAVDTCQTLFDIQTVNLNELYSPNTFAMGPAFREIFKFGDKNKVDYTRSGLIWKESLKSLSEAQKNKIKQDLKSKKTQGARFYNNDFLWNIDLLIFSLDPFAFTQWIHETQTSPRSYKMTWQLALFIRAFDHELAFKMASIAIQKYPQALKTRDVLSFNSELSGYTDIIPGKRSLMVLFKVLLGLPEKIHSHSRNGQIKFKSIEKEILNFQKLIEQQLNQKAITHPRQIVAVIQELQLIIRSYLKLQPHPKSDDVYLVLDGSFANGLALTNKSDIDLAIFNTSLRQHVHEQLGNIQKALYNRMLETGYTDSILSVENIAAIHPEHFTTPTSDLSFGFIGTVSFKISAHKVEIIVYDYEKSTPQKVVLSTYEIVQ